MSKYRFQFETEEQRLNILNEHKDKYLVEEARLFDGNFLVFTDVRPMELELNELKTRTAATEDALLALMMIGGN